MSTLLTSFLTTFQNAFRYISMIPLMYIAYQVAGNNAPLPGNSLVLEYCLFDNRDIKHWKGNAKAGNHSPEQESVVGESLED